MSTEIIDKLSIYERITRAIHAIDLGGEIVSMQINAMQDDRLVIATIDTTDIPYPSQMTASIKTALETRRETIAGELAALGVTGLGA